MTIQWSGLSGSSWTMSAICATAITANQPIDRGWTSTTNAARTVAMLHGESSRPWLCTVRWMIEANAHRRTNASMKRSDSGSARMRSGVTEVVPSIAPPVPPASPYTDSSGATLRAGAGGPPGKRRIGRPSGRGDTGDEVRRALEDRGSVIVERRDVEGLRERDDLHVRRGDPLEDDRLRGAVDDVVVGGAEVDQRGLDLRQVRDQRLPRPDQRVDRLQGRAGVAVLLDPGLLDVVGDARER